MAEGKTDQEIKDLTLEWCQSGPNSLIQVGQGIDTKLIGILSTSSILIGVTVSIMTGVAASEKAAVFEPWWPATFLVGAASAWLVNLVGTIFAVRASEYERTNDPRGMKAHWNSSTLERVRETRWTVLQRAQANNAVIAERKGKWLIWGMRLLGLETAALVLWVGLSSAFVL